ncbi:hypothetical protein OG858_47415 (plasmid) [Streptomyces europaeiscabiei]|uniref:hypothetical protein n=1 Tax=Streptomyces europaeiscabiei TaxID=146819 RepID=UPI002E804F34|nr:hypothetical protein [Streptomyces europaeiscabiei]WUD38829.1 hypothetical protein OG858_47415 [Streptomyces europaeiscabiei]
MTTPRSDQVMPPPWTAKQMDAYESARALLSAVIAAYSTRIGSSTAPQEADRLKDLRSAHVVERRDLTAGHTARVNEINRDFVALLAAVQAGEQ